MAACEGHPGLVNLKPVTCWLCGADVPLDRYPGRFCSTTHAYDYWGFEGGAAHALPVDPA
jgi:hypothetical protein